MTCFFENKQSRIAPANPLSIDQCSMLSFIQRKVQLNPNRGGVGTLLNVKQDYNKTVILFVSSFCFVYAFDKGE